VAIVLDTCYAWDAGWCEWTIGRLWSSWNWFAERGVVILLALMAMNIMVTALERLYCYARSHMRSRVFRRDAGPALREGRFDEVIAIAVRSPDSPIPSVVAEGVRAFESVPPQFTNREATDAAERASQRIIAILTADWSKGLGTLRTLAGLAPFVGLVGTCFGVFHSFAGTAMQKGTAIGMTAWFIATALVLTAAGLFVGILGVWSHNFLWRRLEVLRSQMLQAQASTLDALKAHPEWRHGHKQTAATPSRGFLTTETPWWEVSYDRPRIIFVAIWMAGLYFVIELVRRSLSFYNYYHSR
jgi:biopolymer transport protein TolQ